MKKSNGLIFILLILQLAALSAKDLDFSLGISTDYITGNYREIVYPGSTSVNNYLSELIWNLDNVFVVNAEGILSYKGLSLSCSAGSSVNQGTGIMTDTDWTDYADTDRTHWSESEIFIENSLLLDINLYYTYKTSDIISTVIGTGYRMNFWDWEDKIIDYTYPTPPDPDIIGENGIDYQVTQHIFYIDTGIVVKDENVIGSVNFRYSPYVYAWSLDHHLLRSESPYFFKDMFTANIWYEIDFSVKIETGNYGSFLIGYSRQELVETVGDTHNYDKDPLDSELIGAFLGTTENGAGMASVISKFSISYIYNLW